jgi:hypothetical protein
MAVWLYQMSDDGKHYSKKNYVEEVWESNPYRWPIQRKIPKNKNLVVGDIIVLFYTPSKAKTNKVGICGLGIITKAKKNASGFEFTPINPSNFMKNNPIWDNSIKDLMKQARGEKVFQGTMWRTHSKLARKVLVRILLGRNL